LLHYCGARGLSWTFRSCQGRHNRAWISGYPADTQILSLADVLNGVPPANTGPILVDYEPGSRFQYSGGGYMIMLQLLIDVTGKPFPNLLKEASSSRSE
jgi:CubicO group peptidase (beta-lactamase class C family)